MMPSFLSDLINLSSAERALKKQLRADFASPVTVGLKRTLIDLEQKPELHGFAHPRLCKGLIAKLGAGNVQFFLDITGALAASSFAADLPPECLPRGLEKMGKARRHSDEMRAYRTSNRETAHVIGEKIATNPAMIGNNPTTFFENLADALTSRESRWRQNESLVAMANALEGNPVAMTAFAKGAMDILTDKDTETVVQVRFLEEFAQCPTLFAALEPKTVASIAHEALMDDTLVAQYVTIKETLDLYPAHSLALAATPHSKRAISFTAATVGISHEASLLLWVAGDEALAFVGGDERKSATACIREWMHPGSNMEQSECRAARKTGIPLVFEGLATLSHSADKGVSSAALHVLGELGYHYNAKWRGQLPPAARSRIDTVYKPFSKPVFRRI